MAIIEPTEELDRSHPPVDHDTSASAGSGSNETEESGKRTRSEKTRPEQTDPKRARGSRRRSKK
jgi:hypothetical protein